MTASRRLRIAMVAACPFPARRGTPIRVERLAEALTRRGHEVHVVAYRDGEPEPAQGFPFRVHRGSGLPWAKVGRPGPTYAKLLLHDPILALILRRVLARQRFDVLHAHHYEGLLAAFCKPPGRLPAVVYDAHTTLGAELPYYGLGLPQGVRTWAARVLDRRLPGRAAHVVAVSDGVRDALLSAGLPRDRVTVVGNGVRVDRFEELSDPVPTTVVYAGNLAAYQRIDLLLEAFAILRRRSSEARLVIASEEDPAPLSPLLRAHGLDGATVSLRHVPFAGLPPVLAAAGIAVSPRTDCPGTPQKVLNYMAAGLPTVACAGSAGELRHGETGLVVPNGDAAALAEAVAGLTADPALARRLGGEARRTVQATRSWDAAAARLEALYLGMLGGPASSRSRPDQLLHDAPLDVRRDGNTEPG